MEESAVLEKRIIGFSLMSYTTLQASSPPLNGLWKEVISLNDMNNDFIVKMGIHPMMDEREVQRRYQQYQVMNVTTQKYDEQNNLMRNVWTADNSSSQQTGRKG